jgi:hypothetical protein
MRNVNISQTMVEYSLTLGPLSLGSTLRLFARLVLIIVALYFPAYRCYAYLTASNIAVPVAKHGGVQGPLHPAATTA